MIDILLSPAIQMTLALLLDHWLGETRRFHPLVGFGRYARWLEKKLYPDDNASNYIRLYTGTVALLSATLPITLTLWVLSQVPMISWVLEVLLLYIVVGRTSLIQHAEYVSTALKEGDLSEARNKVGWIVSRQTDQLQPPAITKATIESVLENGNDAVFGALFWFLVAGAPGAVLYRMTNTLDAMWGYKNERFLFFGRPAARFDDLLNLIPGQLCALTYALFGNTRNAIRCWITQASHYKSFNGGSVMASGAASLGFSLGGTAIYHGKTVTGTPLGNGAPPEIHDIDRATYLITQGSILWCLLAVAATCFSYLI